MIESPWLVQRGDGAMVQLSPLLFAVATHLDGSPLDLVATRVSADVDRRVSESNVEHLIDHKLVPLGLVPSGSGPPLAGHVPRPVLTLALRGRALSASAVGRVARVFGPLFWPPIVILVVLAVVALTLVASTSTPCSSS